MSLILNPYAEGLIHGCDYNPEQWLHRPELLKKDLRLMQEAGINMVSLGIFSWQMLEPEEGVYRFDWMDGIIEDLHRAGIGICLATAAAAYPHWLALRYPEVVRKTFAGDQMQSGWRHNFCCSSGVYREKTGQLIRRLSRRYGSHPAVVCWHVNNEYGGRPDASRCYCPDCISGFQEWLKRRYDRDLEKLNRKWWTNFWSHGYSDWSQIRPGDSSVGGLTVNWQRFCAEQQHSFLRHEIDHIREFSELPVTTNFFGCGANADDRLLSRELDFASFDSYPAIRGNESDEVSILGTALQFDRMRGLLHQPWLLLESCPSQPQYITPTRAKRPGVHRMLSFQAVAHGSEGVCYFQWRAGRGGMEKLHGAVCMWDAPEDTRVFSEVAQVGRDLAALKPLRHSRTPARIALLWDIHVQRHFDCNPGLTGIRSPLERTFEWYRTLLGNHFAADLLSPEDELDGYDLILMAGTFLFSLEQSERLAQAVEKGATVVADSLSSWVDEDHLIHPGGRLGERMRKLFGVRCEEVDCLRPDERVPLKSGSDFLPETAAVYEFCDLIHAEDADVLAEYAGEFYAGRPVLTRKTSGKGTAFYLAASLEESSVEPFLRSLCRTCGLSPLLEGLPKGVIITLRQSEEGDSFYFLYNITDAQKSVQLPSAMKDLLADGVPAQTEWILGPYGIRLLVPA